MKSKLFFLLCFLTLFLSNIYSQCSITDLDVKGINCYNDQDFSVMIDFNFDEVGDDGFTIVGNGNNYGTFFYNDLPIEIENLEGNCITDYEFIVRDVANPSCIASAGIGEICCSEDCEITIHEYVFTDCEEGTIGGEIVFNMINFYSDSILVSTSTGYAGTLPLVNNSIFINDLPAASDVIAFTFSHPSETECSTSLLYESTCVCNINDMEGVIVDCNDSDETYYVRIDFEASMSSDSFLLGGNSVFTGTFAYSELPIVVGPYNFSETTDVNFLAQDSNNAFCFGGIELGVISECPAVCNLDNLVVTPLGCEDGTVTLNITFNNPEPNEGGFTVKIGSQTYGPYEYGNDSYTIDSITSYCLNGPNLILRDVIDESCLIEYDITDELCCESCEFFNIETNVHCDPENSRLFYSFDHQMGGENYYVRIYSDDGSFNEQYGPFGYNYDDGILINDIPNGTYHVQFVAGNNEECEGNTAIEIDCTEEEECSVRDLTYEIVDCEDGDFYVIINFISSGNLGDSFIIRGNGVVYGDNYIYGEEDYTIGPLSADCETIYEFVIIDGANDDCRTAVDFDEAVCCGGDCEAINDVVIESLGCDQENNPQGLVSLLGSFEDTDTIFISINGNNQVAYLFGDQPFEIALTSGENTIVLSTSDDCIYTVNLNIECNDCLIDNLSHEVVECQNGSATIKFGGNIIVGSEIDIFLNGEEEGNYRSDEFPILIDNVNAEDTTIISIISEDFPNCNEEYVILPFECFTGVYDIEDKISIYQSGNQLIIEGLDQEYNYTLYSYHGTIISSGKTDHIILSDHLTSSLYLLSLLGEEHTITKKVFIR